MMRILALLGVIGAAGPIIIGTGGSGGISPPAGQIGGTAGTPTVIGITETSGPTSLTTGTITDGECLKRVGSTLVSAACGSSSILWSKQFAADMFLPVDTGWTSASAHASALATLEVANLVNFRAFDQTTAEGIGLEIVLPTGAVNINAIADLAAATSGFTSSNGVQITLCCRPKYGTGSFVCVDGAAITLTDNATIQRKTQTWTLAGLSLTAGTVAICEEARDVADADDTLTRDLRQTDLLIEVTP